MSIVALNSSRFKEAAARIRRQPQLPLKVTVPPRQPESPRLRWKSVPSPRTGDTGITVAKTNKTHSRRVGRR